MHTCVPSLQLTTLCPRVSKPRVCVSLWSSVLTSATPLRSVRDLPYVVLLHRQLSLPLEDSGGINNVCRYASESRFSVFQADLDSVLYSAHNSVAVGTHPVVHIGHIRVGLDVEIPYPVVSGLSRHLGLSSYMRYGIQKEK